MKRKQEKAAREITRREALRLALAAPFLGLGPTGDAPWSDGGRSLRPTPAASAEPKAKSLGLTGGAPRPDGRRSPGLSSLAEAPFRVTSAGDPREVEKVRLIRKWDGPLCRSELVNEGRTPARIKEVVLFDVAHGLPPETALYGEGFQMLSQTGGTLGLPQDLGDYTDAKHYRLPEPAGARVLYGLLTLAPPEGPQHLLAFTSCRRFSGQFVLRAASLEVIVDTEGRELPPGEKWTLEELTYRSGPDREGLLAALADRLVENHPPLLGKEPPSGWCSWYCFGPRVTAQQVLDNLETIAREVPGLRYIQIDDGYQPAMGDWLETGPAFGGNVRAVLRQIRERGFEPALWVAPFVAEKESRLFREHADWFVKDGDGQPLRADQVTFGGWRRGPWYVLDGTHPAAQKHLEDVFRTLRQDWGCTYFKLDANFWGAIQGGRFHDPRATRIEAYRRGMEAIRRGAGDAFILGCNHPVWASLGLVHGSRSSNDIKRAWNRVSGTARQNLGRNWQNGRLWWNDPDVVVLTGLSEDEIRFHAAAVYATGGMMLAGDDLTALGRERLAMLRKLQPPTGRAASFADGALRMGVVERQGRRVVCLLNWDEAPRTFSVPLPGPHRVRDFWSDDDLGRHQGTYVTPALPAHSGRLLVCTADA